MEDLISRQAAIDALGERPLTWTGGDYELGCRNQYDKDRLAIETVPTAQKEIIKCKDCRFSSTYMYHGEINWTCNNTDDGYGLGGDVSEDSFCSAAIER